MTLFGYFSSGTFSNYFVYSLFANETFAAAINCLVSFRKY